MVRLDPTGNEGVAVVWVDKRATGKEELYNIYTQRLEDGFGPVEPAEAAPPAQFVLAEPYPNPFNSWTMVPFAAGLPGDLRIDLYDLTGRFVRNVTSGWRPAGRHIAALDGETLPAGTYFLRLKTAGFETERKVTLVK
jgi:hypothetical protein